MRTNKITVAVIGCMAGALLNSCQTKEQKVENAEQNVVDANNDLAKAREDFRQENETRLSDNDKMIEDYKGRIAEQKADERAAYQAHVDSLEQRNKELKARLHDYNDNDKDKWESFKREFKHDMDEFGNSFKDVGKNNVK